MYLQKGSLLQGGKYEIVRFIASGGFGCTYEAYHPMLDKKVAIKEFFPKSFCNRDSDTSHVSVGTMSQKPLVEKLKKKFVDEARSIAKLSHNGIVKVSDVFEENGTAYYVMDYIEGKSLGEIIKERGPLSEKETLKYIHQVCDALAYVHDKNRLHLDIKPGNIMIDEEDNAKLIDFGASKQYDEENGENTSTLIGKTPGFAPIEQTGNDVSRFRPATDIYSLGATLYKCLSGKTPPEVNLLVQGDELDPLPANVSDSTKNVIKAAMEISPKKRPQTIKEFEAILNETAPTKKSEEDKEVTIIEAQKDTKSPETKNEEPIVKTPQSTYIPPKIPSEETLISSEQNNEPVITAPPGVENNDEEDYDYDEEEKTNSKSKIYLGIAIAAVIGLICWWAFGGNKDENTTLNTQGEEISLVTEGEQSSDSVSGAQSLTELSNQVQESPKKESSTSTVSDNVISNKTEPGGDNDKKPTKNEETMEDEARTNVKKMTEGAEDFISQENINADVIIVEDTKPIVPEKIWEAVEQKPEFPGGDAAMYKFIADNIIYPAEAAKENIQGTVVIRFVVEKDGSVTQVTVARGKNPALDKEAVRVVKSFPKFIPGKMNGEPVRVYYTLPVRFKIQ